MAKTREDIEAILESGGFDSLLGEIETEWFDAKGEPYQITEDAETQKRELAKDVSSFANSDGGVIVIGLATKKSTSHFGDEVVEIRSFSQSLVDTSQYRNILDDWIYPKVDGLHISWQESTDTPGKGLVMISISKQKPSDKPFLVKKIVASKKHSTTVFGYATRRGDANTSFGVVDLQKALQAGLNTARLEERLDGLEQLILQNIKDRPPHKATPPAHLGLVTERVGAAITGAQLYDVPLMVLSAYPLTNVRLRTLFSGANDSIRRQMERPPRMRSSGWDLATFSQSQIIAGKMVRAARINRKSLDLYPDGTFVFVTRADAEALAWSSPNGERQLNPLAIAETIYSFARFYQLVIEDMDNRPLRVAFRVDLQHTKSHGMTTTLSPYRLGSIEYEMTTEEREAPDDMFNTELQIETRTFDAEMLTYQLVREIYIWFGLDVEQIPYVINKNGEDAFDPTTLMKQ